MNIGILTLHEAESYGAVLQAYALQRTLDGLGADSRFVCFDRPRPAAAEAPARVPPMLLGRVRQEGQRRAALFAAFREGHLRCAAPVPWGEAARAAERYDRLVTGSDQVWNPRVPAVDERYFLPFAPPEKRFSYAASFGGEDLPAGVRDWCAGELRRFAGLSVRERSGAALVRELTGREAVVCLDPTLLPERAVWEALSGPPEKEGHVLLFLLQYDATLAAQAKAEAARRGAALEVVTAAFMPQFGFGAWSGVGVEDWLRAVRGAGCVFTNSFHGAVFALLFGRPLRAAGLTGGLAGRNGRLGELLRMAGMEDALERLCPAPDPGTLTARLAPARAASMAYLKGMIAGGAL